MEELAMRLCQGAVGRHPVEDDIDQDAEAMGACALRDVG